MPAQNIPIIMQQNSAFGKSTILMLRAYEADARIVENLNERIRSKELAQRSVLSINRPLLIIGHGLQMAKMDDIIARIKSGKPDTSVPPTAIDLNQFPNFSAPCERTAGDYFFPLIRFISEEEHNLSVDSNALLKPQQDPRKFVQLHEDSSFTWGKGEHLFPKRGPLQVRPIGLPSNEPIGTEQGPPYQSHFFTKWPYRNIVPNHILAEDYFSTSSDATDRTRDTGGATTGLFREYAAVLDLLQHGRQDNVSQPPKTLEFLDGQNLQPFQQLGLVDMLFVGKGRTTLLEILQYLYERKIRHSEIRVFCCRRIDGGFWDLFKTHKSYEWLSIASLRERRARDESYKVFLETKIAELRNKVVTGAWQSDDPIERINNRLFLSEIEDINAIRARIGYPMIFIPKELSPPPR